MICGLVSHVDVIDGENLAKNGCGRRVTGDIVDMTTDGFVANPRSFAGCLPYALSMSWLTLPDNRIHFETGNYETYTVRTPNKKITALRIHFLSALFQSSGRARLVGDL